jgi:hypothetical protein
MPEVPANANVVFLPWVRQGAAAAIATHDTLGPSQRGAVDLSIGLSINGAQALPVAVRLRGPADVVGIDPHEIVRMDPRPNTADFEPNYFAAIEFDRPDFPWLFTPARAGANARLRPWLCLVVVRKQDGVVLRSSADAPLPALEIAAPAKPSDELPDLSESWAWTHAQVASPSNASPTELRAALSGRPERSLSRLLCPRLLQPNTDYIACVVPTFELGRKAGLGLEIKDIELTSAAGLTPAWSLTPAPAVVTLPVYHHWRFRTGEGGDFESLVRLLRAYGAPEGLGRRPMDIGRPGFRLPPAFPADARLDLEGALQPMETKDLAPWPAGAEEPFQTELVRIVNAPGSAEAIDPNADPLLAPPLYGCWHAARPTVTRGAAAWFDALNLDPRHRSVAAFGTRVIQEHQEALMAAAWEQAADLERANQRMRQLQLSLVVATSLHARHFLRLSEEAVLRVSAPALGRIRAGAVDAPATRTLAAQLNASAVPLSATSSAMRRIGRERGPITRRVAAQGVARPATSTWVAKLNLDSAAVFVAPPRADLATVDIVRQRVAQPAAISPFASVTDTVVGNMRGRPTFRVAPEGQTVTVPPFQNLPPSADSPTAKNFRSAARAHLARINPARLGMIFAPRPSLALRQVRDALVAQIEPKRTLVLLARAIVSTGGNATQPTNTTAVPIDTIMAAPKFRQPMYEPLRDLSQQLLLPGLETVLPNSVLGLQTNRRFVEGYMVGLNFEMGRELLWRGFPTDQRGTYFDQFWDVRSAGNLRPDVHPLHQWGTRVLGDAKTSPAGEQFVMLLRSDLLRRYPTAVIYAAKAIVVDGVRTPSTNPAEEVHPAFRGSMQPDVSFFGFDLTVDQVVGSGGGSGVASSAGQAGYFIVIQEQPTEPRFGLDVGTPVGEGTHLKVSAGVPAGTPLNGLQWGHNAAHMAGILRQQPVRIAIHASQFLLRR